MPQDVFPGALAKLTIANIPEPLDGAKFEVRAQYNPKELQVTQPIGWTEHEGLDVPASAGRVMEFGGMKAASMQVELLFDDVETFGTPAAKPVMKAIDTLKKLASVQDPHSPDEALRRPYYCVVSWGDHGMPKFRCVIESLTIKYLMFSKNGDILRASVTIALKEADRVKLAQAESAKNRARAQQKQARKSA